MQDGLYHAQATPSRVVPFAKAATTGTRDEVTEKQLPHNLDAEAAMIGSWLIDPEAFAAVLAVAGPEDCYRDTHRTIYQAGADFYAVSGTPPDLITLCDELGRRGQLEEVGGIAFVGSLANQVPTSRNAVHYARIVKRTALMRRLLDAAAKIAGMAYNEPDADVAMALAQALIYEIAELATPDSLFPIMDDDEAELLEPSQGILGDLLYADTLAILYGRAGRWKSFVALSMALCIATGRSWLGRPTVAGSVLYVAAEGGRGIGKRITAWKRQHGVSGKTRLKTLLVPVQLLEDGQVEKLVSSVKARCGDDLPVLVVLDTLSRSMAGGDANASKDGSRAIEQADKIRRAFGCCVLIVAHPGKDESRGISGWAGYFNAADTVMKVDSAHNNPRLEVGETVKLTSEKPKDADPFADIALTTLKQEWSHNDGSPVSSLVVLASDLDTFEAERDPEAVPFKQSEALRVLDAAPDGKLPANKWQQLSGMSRSGFFKALKLWQASGIVHLGDDGQYARSPASPLRSTSVHWTERD